MMVLDWSERVPYLTILELVTVQFSSRYYPTLLYYYRYVPL